MNTDIATNKKALRDYEILEKYEAGIQLVGTEVKSIRGGKLNLRDAFARVEGGQMFLYGADIQPYEKASIENHVAKRPRRLLLHKKEIYKIFLKSEVRGCTIVALRAYWKGRRVKIEIGIGKGKGQTDKREDIKKRVMKLEADREVARFHKGKK
jgi:SsrA-binding protein